MQQDVAPSRPPLGRWRSLTLLLALCGLLTPIGFSARAQDARPDTVSQDARPDTVSQDAGPSAVSQDAPAAANDSLTPAERRHLREILDDPDKRAALARDLGTPVQIAPAVRAASKPTAPIKPVAAAGTTPGAAPKKVSIDPESLAGQILSDATIVQTTILARARAFTSPFADVGLVVRWLHREMVAPEARAALLDAFWRGSLVVLVGLAAEHLLLLALRRPLRALGRDAQVVEDESEENDPDLETDDPAISDLQPAPQDGPPGLVQAGPPRPPGILTPAPVPGAALPGSPILPTAPLPQAIDAALLRESADRIAAEAEARQRDAAHRRTTLRLFRRIPYALLRLVLKLVPLCAFLALGNIAATTTASQPRTQIIIVTVTNLYGIGRTIWLLADMLLSPKAPGVRLIRVTDQTARFLVRWWSWLLAIPVVAICITDVGNILDLPPRGGHAIVRAVILVEHILVAVLIWKTRATVAASLRPPRRTRKRSFGLILTRLADRWWITALFFDAALWVVWAAQIRGGYAKMWQLFVSTVIVVTVCRLIGIMLLGGLDRMFRKSDAELQVSGLERRASRYYPVLRRLVTWALFVAGVVALLQAWGLPALGFFARGTLGTRLVSASLTILVTLSVGVAVWELINGALDRQINRFTDIGQTPRAVRLQTLLPILRTLLMIVLGAIVGATILSQIGVNIAPLLAGAGIVGVAVGFGSQKLVQDFITGIFLLVENAMQVGDNVTVAGVSGTVEHISIRTLRLRGGDGSIQIIPFSSVSTVANMSRDYAVASVGISIAFSEDTDRICDLLNEIGAELRTEEGFAEHTLADFGLNGVDSLGEYAVAISGTIRCTVGGRWPVQREFNRRLRRRIAELGIALPEAHRSIHMPSMAALLEQAGRNAAPDEDAPPSAPHHEQEERSHG